MFEMSIYQSIAAIQYVNAFVIVSFITYDIHIDLVMRKNKLKLFLLFTAVKAPNDK